MDIKVVLNRAWRLFNAYTVFAKRYITNLSLRIYKDSFLQKFVFFLKFIFHRYDAHQFSPLHLKENFRELGRKRTHDWLDTTSSGELYLRTTRGQKIWFDIKDTLFFGAFRSRLTRVLQMTFITFCIELNNPFNKEILKNFLYRKIYFARRLLKKLHLLNGKYWDLADIEIQIWIYERQSLIQEEMIRWMEKAVDQQKDPEIIQQAKEGLKKGIYPILSIKGSSGSYWMRAKNRAILGLFKPFDEEAYAPNNPVGPSFQGALGSRKMRSGVRVGESAHREVAAFLVDKFFEFGIVPRTYYATFTHPGFYHFREGPNPSRREPKKKMGSFQEYIGGFSALTDIPRNEHKRIPLDEFQLLILLDVIIGNSDRNTGNILLGTEKIAAIDHGLSFPDIHEPVMSWFWVAMEQGKKPFYPAMKELLLNFPYEKLSHRLNKHAFIQLPSLHRMRERVALFAEGVSRDLTPRQLANLLIPQNLNPLFGLDLTLKDKARQIVDDYLTKDPELRDLNL